jgi:hypothetical protein
MAFLDQGRDPTPNLPSDTESKLRNQVLSQLVMALTNVLPRTLGTFQLAAAATKTVTGTRREGEQHCVLCPDQRRGGNADERGEVALLGLGRQRRGRIVHGENRGWHERGGHRAFAYFVISPV